MAAALTFEEEDDEEVKWVTHYSSIHDILLVGEGDFSFSRSLASIFGSASNIVATSLDPFEVVIAKYKNAKSNLESLKIMGATLLHGIDATKMKLHTDLKMRKFDRVVFNFPHAGFKGKEDNIRLINLHRKLVLGFFKSASHMLRPYGEVHVSHKTGIPFCHWNLEELASRNFLALMEKVEFKIHDYPGYNNKRGDGKRCDDPFPLGECSTFKFRIGNISKKESSNSTFAITNGVTQNNLNTLGVNTGASHLLYNSGSTDRCRAGSIINVNDAPGYFCSPTITGTWTSSSFGTLITYGNPGFLGSPIQTYITGITRGTVVSDYNMQSPEHRLLELLRNARSQRMFQGLMPRIQGGVRAICRGDPF